MWVCRDGASLALRMTKKSCTVVCHAEHREAPSPAVPLRYLPAVRSACGSPGLIGCEWVARQRPPGDEVAGLRNAPDESGCDSAVSPRTGSRYARCDSRVYPAHTRSPATSSPGELRYATILTTERTTSLRRSPHQGAASSRRMNPAISSPLTLVKALSSPTTAKPHFSNTRREALLCLAT